MQLSLNFERNSVSTYTYHFHEQNSTTADLHIVQSDDSEDDEEQFLSGTIVGIQNIIIYHSCPNPKCRNKKLDPSSKCPCCQQSFKPDEIKRVYVCNLCVLKPDGTLQTMTMFTKVFLTLFNYDKHHYTSQQFTAAVLKKLPLHLQYKANNDIINEISEK